MFTGLKEDIKCEKTKKRNEDRKRRKQRKRGNIRVIEPVEKGFT